MKYKVGDYINLVSPVEGNDIRTKASKDKIYKIISIDNDIGFPYRIECLDKRVEKLPFSERPYIICRDDECRLATEQEVIAWMI